jgi:hypothetical protein
MDIYTITINNEVEVTYNSAEKCYYYLANRFNDCIVLHTRKDWKQSRAEQSAVSMDSITKELNQYLNSRIEVKTGIKVMDKTITIYKTKLN